MLSEMLARMAIDTSYERAKPFKGSDFGNFVRHDVAMEAKKAVSLWPYDLTVKASVGAGNWAAVPWLAFFDPIETNTATKGTYVVYLINPIEQTVILSLNQGATEMYKEFGAVKGRKALARRAEAMADRVADYTKYFSRDAITLSSQEDLPLGYEAGHAIGKTYSLEELSQDGFMADLQHMLEAYAALIDRGSHMPIDMMFAQSGSTDINETRRYVLSRRIERSANVRNTVIAQRGAVCECCGFDPKKHFGYAGPIQNSPLDVHHARPLSSLREGETRRYTVPDDFLVLCPTCHRMIHKQDDPADLKALKNRLRFTIAQDASYPLL